MALFPPTSLLLIVTIDFCHSSLSLIIDFDHHLWSFVWIAYFDRPLWSSPLIIAFDHRFWLFILIVVFHHWFSPESLVPSLRMDWCLYVDFQRHLEAWLPFTPVSTSCSVPILDRLNDECLIQSIHQSWGVQGFSNGLFFEYYSDDQNFFISILFVSKPWVVIVIHTSHLIHRPSMSRLECLIEGLHQFIERFALSNAPKRVTPSTFVPLWNVSHVTPSHLLTLSIRLSLFVSHFRMITFENLAYKLCILSHVLLPEFLMGAIFPLLISLVSWVSQLVSSMHWQQWSKSSKTCKKYTIWMSIWKDPLFEETMNDVSHRVLDRSKVSQSSQANLVDLSYHPRSNCTSIITPTLHLSCFNLATITQQIYSRVSWSRIKLWSKCTTNKKSNTFLQLVIQSARRGWLW